MAHHSNTLVQATSVINQDVKSTNDESLGKIEDIMLDKQTGEVHYAVLSFGGFMGMGEKPFALPWKTLHYSTDSKCFVLNIEKDKLKQAPGFDKGQWPDIADTQWQADIKTFYE